MKTYKIFKGKTLQEAMNKLLDEGYTPLDSGETYDFRAENNREDELFDTASIIQKGRVRRATIEELRDIKKLYDNKGRLVFLLSDSHGLDGYNSINSDGRFPGVKEITEKIWVLKKDSTIRVQESAKEDFKKSIGWSEEEFEKNMIQTKGGTKK